ncbi:MAG: hypothetical protein ACTHQE_17170 [Thermomicrobiales bacterium]
MADWAQVFLESNVDDGQVAEAVAHAFSLAPRQVCVVPGPSERSFDAWQDRSVRVLVVRNTVFDLTGERFPYLLELQTRDGADITPATIRMLGEVLRTPFVTNIGGDSEGYRWSLVLPDGAIRSVRVDEDDQFVLSLDDVQAIERARVPSHRAA